jgi:succinate-semialdehyde dehydrogenase/glutarate-semialdehyde dehydrogenase
MDYQTINPATGEIVATFPTISDEALEQATKQAHAAYLDWRGRPVEERARLMSAAAARLRRDVDRHANLVTLEMGKGIAWAAGEVALAADILDYYAAHAEDFLKPTAVPGVAQATLLTRPLGVILAVEPWNFPYYQVARVIGPQLMVGNTVILKHAESVPQCAAAFVELLEQVGFPQGVFTNVYASHDQISTLIADPRVVGVTVTGSERAGAKIAELAGKSLKKVVLELGGSDPFIVLADASLEAAADAALLGRMANAGQSCIAAKRMIVVGEDRGRTFLEIYLEKLKQIQAGDPLDQATLVGPVSSERALEGLLWQIESARAGGATVLAGGRRINRPGFFLEPTLLTDIAADNPVYGREIFGPVASLYVVNDESEAIRLANDTSYGLGAAIFTGDVDYGRALAEQIESGMVFINQMSWTGAELPFGGIKNSGFGRELAEAGFAEFVNRKLVHAAPVGAPLYGPVPAASA